MSMDKDKVFEDQLRRVKPVRIDALLEERLAKRIRESDKRERSSRWTGYIFWAGLLAAACVMLVVGLSLFTGRRGPLTEASVAETSSGAVEALAVPEYTVDDQAFKPVLAQNTLTDRIDEGIVFLDSGLTARKYRYQFIDRVVWRNPRNGARVEMQVPRDEVVLIPVQTY